MKCPHCSATVPSDAKYCPQCATAITAESKLNAAPATTEGTAPGMAKNPFRTGRAPIADVPEETLWQGGYCAQAMYGQWLMAAALTLFGTIALLIWGRGEHAGWLWASFLIGIVLLWIGLGLLYAYRRYTMKFKLTNLRFFHEYGLLTNTVERIEVISMDDISFRQSLIERFLKIGNLTIISSDRTQPELRLKGIANVREVADLFDKARRLERQRRGVYVEAM